MGLKSNINKIDYNLNKSFNNVKIEEKSSVNKGYHIELTINENNKLLKAIISKSNLEYPIFNWGYLADPNDENSHFVERRSNINDFTDDIKEIFEKNRFDADYIKTLK